MIWDIWYFQLFLSKMELFEATLKRLRSRNPEKLKSHPMLRLYIALVKAIAEVRKDPTLNIYRLGKTLGEKHTDWRRVKHGLPGERYRLFFKFFSKNHDIFFVWLNDNHSLRTKDAKNDCYAVFRRMLDSGKVPSAYSELVKTSSSVPDRSQ